MRDKVTRKASEADIICSSVFESIRRSTCWFQFVIKQKKIVAKELHTAEKAAFAVVRRILFCFRRPNTNNNNK